MPYHASLSKFKDPNKEWSLEQDVPWGGGVCLCLCWGSGAAAGGCLHGGGLALRRSGSWSQPQVCSLYAPSLPSHFQVIAQGCQDRGGSYESNLGSGHISCSYFFQWTDFGKVVSLSFIVFCQSWNWHPLSNLHHGSWLGLPDKQIMQNTVQSEF